MKTPQDDANRPQLFTGSDNHSTRSTAAQIATTIHSAGVGVIVTDVKGQIEYLNRIAEQLVGMASGDAQGRPLNEVLRLEERDGRKVKNNLVELAIISDAPVDLGYDLVLTGLTGTSRQVEGEIAVCSSADGVIGAVLTLRDVTARLRDDVQRREDHTTRAVGRLAGAVAHDLNSSLTIILGQCEAIESAPADAYQVSQSIAEIRRSAVDMTTVTRQLLTLSRRAVLSPKAISLNTVLEKLVHKLPKRVPCKWNIVLRLAPYLGPVLADEGQMEQVLADLLSYCSDRMPTGGRIEVMTENVIVEEAHRARHSKRFVKLSVLDQGPSVKGAALQEMLEPTWTRGRGMSSGLSLFSIQSAMNAAQGHLAVESTGDIGVKFVLLLPEVEEAPDIVVDVETKIRRAEQPTILLVEDDDGIRILLRNSLQKRGYCVIEARDGVEGVLQAELYEGIIDLLVTDVVMPVMDGPALAENVLRARPSIKMLLISGCPEDLVHTQKLVSRGASFLQKPFSQRELVARVDEILQNGRRTS